MKAIQSIVIVGNGAGGNAAAAAIRKSTTDVPISIFSDEHYPQYSPCFLDEYISGSLNKESLFIKTERAYSREGIEAFLGEPVLEINGSDKFIVYERGRRQFDKLILATGGRPILPQIEGINLNGVFTLKNLNEAEQISQFVSEHKALTALVIGAGLIGVELAIALKTRGLQVYLVERERCILSRIFEADMAGRLRAELESNGIKVITATEVLRISGMKKVESVLLRDGGLIDVDIVVFSIGKRPDVDSAKKAGIETGYLGGIVTDGNMRTNIPDIYACGDCTEFKDPLTNKNVVSGLWPNAVIGGRVAGFHSVGVSKEMARPINLNCLEVFGLNAVSMGYSSYSLGELSGTQIVEEKTRQADYRMILRDGNVLGMQVIASNNLPSLLGLIHNSKTFSAIENRLGCTLFMAKNPFHFPWPTRKHSENSKRIGSD